MKFAFKQGLEQLGIAISEMQDGDVAVIVEWDNHNREGVVVQRVADDLRLIGQPSSRGYSVFFPRSSNCCCRVKLLEAGDAIVRTK